MLNTHLQHAPNPITHHECLLAAANSSHTSETSETCGTDACNMQQTRQKKLCSLHKMRMGERRRITSRRGSPGLREARRQGIMGARVGGDLASMEGIADDGARAQGSRVRGLPTSTCWPQGLHRLGEGAARLPEREGRRGRLDAAGSSRRRWISPLRSQRRSSGTGAHAATFRTLRAGLGPTSTEGASNTATGA
jgi:hypothetical protein